MSQQFHDVMEKLDDEQLMNVIVNRRDYVPEALQAAESVLRQRGMSEREIEAAVAEGEAMEEVARAKAELPLSGRERLLYFVFSFLVATPFVALYYRKYAEEGYDRRSVESQIHVLLGVMFYLAVYGVLQNWVFGNW